MRLARRRPCALFVGRRSRRHIPPARPDIGLSQRSFGTLYLPLSKFSACRILWQNWQC